MPFDPVLRGLHAALASLVVLLVVSGFARHYAEPGITTAWLIALHGYLGAALIVALAGRVLWGLIGPASARWPDLWQPSGWLRAPFENAEPTPRAKHHPHAGVVHLAVYAGLGFSAASGLVLLACVQGLGPLATFYAYDVDLAARIQPLHLYVAWALACFIPVHLAALVLHARLSGRRLAHTMSPLIRRKQT